MATRTGLEYPTQVPFGCATVRLAVAGKCAFSAALSPRGSVVPFSYPIQAPFGLATVRPAAAYSRHVVAVVSYRSAAAWPTFVGGAELVPPTGQLWPVSG